MCENYTQNIKINKWVGELTNKTRRNGSNNVVGMISEQIKHVIGWKHTKLNFNNTEVLSRKSRLCVNDVEISRI